MVYGTIPVTPGETLTVVVGSGGTGGQYTGSVPGGHGGSSGIKRGASFILRAKGGKGGGNSTTEDTNLIDDDAINSGENAGGSGGASGGAGQGGGGAAGYSGDGGNGGGGGSATAGSGGGGGGGAYNTYTSWYGGIGGGTWLYGEGTSGDAGINDGTSNRNGEAGSTDADGAPTNSVAAGRGGGGSPIADAFTPGLNGLSGGSGGVRLVWPGQSSFFPTTNVGQA